MSITIRAGGGLANNQAALDSFNRAASQWTSRLTDPINVLIDADFSDLGANTLGLTDAEIAQGAYDAVRNLLVVDSADEADDGIVEFLPTSTQFRAAVPAGTTRSDQLIATRANFKALGVTIADSVFDTDRDGIILFNTRFLSSFDFDNRDNTGPTGLTDFETVAAHEIGHLLGFVSSVDQADQGAARIFATTQDLYRFANGSAPSSASEFQTAERSLLFGSEAVISDTVSQFRMSTGVNRGDGRQASHWKANELTGTTIGIMDPTLGTDEIIRVGNADLRAMDLIGYDVVITPEPGTALLLLPALVGLLHVRARRRPKAGVK